MLALVDDARVSTSHGFGGPDIRELAVSADSQAKMLRAKMA